MNVSPILETGSPSKRPRSLAWPLVWACTAATLLVGCSEPSQDADSPAAASSPTVIEVRGVEAWTSPVEETSRYIGSTRAVDSVQITSQVASKVEWIGFDDGQQVTEGDPLVRLDDRRAQADVRSAKARVDRLKLSEARIESAYESGAANLTELDDIRTAVREAVAELDRAAAVLEDHEINAPFSGRVTRRLVSVGALVQPGDAVAELNSVDPIDIEFAVPETDLLRLKEGQQVIAEVVGLGGERFTGTLATTGAVVNPVSRSAIVHAEVSNPSGTLRPGMFVTVTLVTGLRADAVLIPESALITEGRRTEVFVVRDGKAERQRIEVLKRHRGILEIASGLQPGDQVVTSGIQKIRGGDTVNMTNDADLALLGIIPGLPLKEQPISLGKRERDSSSGPDGS